MIGNNISIDFKTKKKREGRVYDSKLTAQKIKENKLIKSHGRLQHRDHQQSYKQTKKLFALQREEYLTEKRI